MNNIKTETVRASINERKLFETMGNWFATSFSIIGEVMQNARRADASIVSFVTNYDENSLVVTDDGCGIDNFQNLIELATSGWTDEKIQLVDKPFGMGLFSLFYACDTVIFRSRSMKLVICLEDIISKRELRITVDEDQIFKGTKIHLIGLKPKLLAEAGNSWPLSGAKLARRWELDEQILNAAKGFEILVMLNGLVIPQPFAARNLKMEATSIGLVHLTGIHNDSGKIGISGYNGCNSIDYFLQGLPIEKSSRNSGIGNVVHLNSNFIAVMPDRAKLQDADKQLESVQVVLKNLVENHVIRMKFSMPPRDFVRAYFDVASENGFTWLFNDVPYLPSRHFTSVEMVSDDSNMVYVGAGLDADLVSRDDLLGGAVLAWRDAPSCASDSQWAAAMLKYMLVSNTLDINVTKLSKAHWIFDAVPTTVDFTFRVEASGIQGRDTLDANNTTCELVLVDSVALIINSKTDSSFELVHEFNKDWLVVPVKEDNEDVGNFYRELPPMLCFFTRELDSDLSPAYVFSSFTDEHDHYMQDWAEQAVRECKNLMNGLCGGTLSESLQAMFNANHSSPTPNQVAQLALVITTRKCFGHQNLHASYFQAINLEDPAFWESLAVIFEKKTGSNLAENLKGAFLELAKPGEITYPRGMSFELICEAGFNLVSREGRGHFYLYPGHDVNIDTDDMIHTEFFASREDAIASAYDDLEADVCKFHKFTSDKFVKMKFEDKCDLITEAYKPFILNVKANIEEQLTQS